MDHNGLEYYHKQLAWKIMNKKDILLDYIKKNPNKRKYELVNELVHKTKDMQEYIGDIEKDKRIMSYATLNKHLLKLKKEGRILQDKKTKTYSINPNYSKLLEGSEEQLRLMFEKEWDKIQELTNINLLENVLWQMVHDKTKISYNFGEELKDKVFFSNEIQTLIGRLINSLLRECIIMNPELWHIMNKPEHFNFTFNIECNLQEDPNIFSFIQLVKKKCIKNKEVPLFSASPFVRKMKIDYSDPNEIKLIENKKENLEFKIDKSFEDLYNIAVGQDTLFRKEIEKIEKEKQENYQEYLYKEFKNTIKKSQEFYTKKLDEIEGKEEFRQFYEEKLEEYDKLLEQIDEQDRDKILLIISKDRDRVLLDKEN